MQCIGALEIWASQRETVTDLDTCQGLQLELKHVHKAPRVRLSIGIFCFIRTPLISGDTNVPNFLLPFLHVDTVGEAMVDAVYSGYGSIIYLPVLNRVAAMLVSLLLYLSLAWLLRVSRLTWFSCFSAIIERRSRMVLPNHTREHGQLPNQLPRPAGSRQGDGYIAKGVSGQY